jgi:small subunit ribosomal protein S18
MSLNLVSSPSLLRNAATTASVGLSICRWSSTASLSAFTSQRGTTSHSHGMLTQHIELIYCSLYL